MKWRKLCGWFAGRPRYSSRLNVTTREKSNRSSWCREPLGSPGVSGRSVDFLIGVAELHLVFALEQFEKRFAVERCGKEVWELHGREIAGFQREGLVGRVSKTFQLDDSGIGRQGQAGCDFLLVMDNFREQDFGTSGETATGHLFGVAHQLVEVNLGSRYERADAPAALYDTLPLQSSQRMAPGH